MDLKPFLCKHMHLKLACLHFLTMSTAITCSNMALTPAMGNRFEPSIPIDFVILELLKWIIFQCNANEGSPTSAKKNTGNTQTCAQ